MARKDRRRFLTGVVASAVAAPALAAKAATPPPSKAPSALPNPMAFEAFSAYVRHTNRAMPPYQKAILPDADLADIHAYLPSIPPAKDYKSIPLLNQ